MKAQKTQIQTNIETLGLNRLEKKLIESHRKSCTECKTTPYCHSDNTDRKPPGSTNYKCRGTGKLSNKKIIIKKNKKKKRKKKKRRKKKK